MPAAKDGLLRRIIESLGMVPVEVRLCPCVCRLCCVFLHS